MRRRPLRRPPSARRRRGPARGLAVTVAALLAAALLLPLAACRDSGRRPPVLLVGVDGFEWNVALPLLRAGEMPHIAALVDSGAAGLLETTRPTFSPIIWTTIATGKSPRRHGIRGFVAKKKKVGERRLYNSNDRRTKAFWNILSDYDRSVAVVGWWMTYPAEKVNGVMVAQVNTLDQANRKAGRAIIKGSLREDVAGQVYPEERLEEFLEIHHQVSAGLGERTDQIFGRFGVPLTTLTERLWQNTQWAFQADATYVEIAERLAAEGHDLVAFYLGGADVAGHRFWRHMRPELYADPPSAAEAEELGRLIPDYYRYVDRAVGRVLDRMPADTVTLVVSDHGMGAVNRKKVFHEESLPADLNSAHHRDAPPGIFIASGPGVPRAGARPAAELAREDLAALGSVLDVTPTLLALLDVPVGDDMEGRVLARLFDRDLAALPTVASHDDEAWLAARRGLAPEEIETDDERLEQLRALGYVN